MFTTQLGPLTARCAIMARRLLRRFGDQGGNAMLIFGLR